MQVTNDGATILKAIGVDNPAAKILVGNSLRLEQEFQFEMAIKNIQFF